MYNAAANFGLYLHWPFCESKCPYCDFNSHVADAVNEAVWLDAFQRELTRLGSVTKDRLLSTVFFGGGTPSKMSPRLVDGILTCVRSTWNMTNDSEITLEANPGSVELQNFEGYRLAGVNRISLGIQSLSDVDLKRLGRKHTTREALIALDIARHTFDRVSIDLIYARQGQTRSAWEQELTRALSFGVDHLSLYQLTVEPGTIFARRYAEGKLLGLPDEDLSVDLYDATQSICEAYGMPAYEVSNHAHPGSESRHNMIYWTGGDYGGIGPGAHGRLSLNGTRWATECYRSPGDWLNKAKSGSAEKERVAISAEDQALEYLIMGLRVSQGISLERLSRMATLDQQCRKFLDLVDEGFVLLNGDQLKATEKGRILLNSVILAIAESLVSDPGSALSGVSIDAG